MEKGKQHMSKVESNNDNAYPEAKYTLFGERIRQAIPGSMQCSMACGGRNCKWENPARWSDADQAIKGVFSTWVLEDVVAMSRPSTEVIEKYDMIEQFKKHNICSIINLQRTGEHASCGPPLDKDSLFTYRPKDFMDSDIFFYNFGWKDYGVTSLHTILDMVKVMCFALEQGRVAVHCHAGLGRTGVLIACYLVFARRMESGAAIMRVRQKRSNSIQTRGQIACVHEFCQFLRPLRIVFPQVVPHSKRLSLKQFLTRQSHLLHGFESRELKYTPKVVHVVCNRLIEMTKVSSGWAVLAANDEINKSTPVRRCHTVADIKETVPGAFVNEAEEIDVDNLILSSPPTDVDAVLSPRVSRRGSGRTRGVSESSNRPSSAGEATSQAVEENSSFQDVSRADGDRSLPAITAAPSSPSICMVKSRVGSAKSTISPSNSYADFEEGMKNAEEPGITFVKSQSSTRLRSAEHFPVKAGTAQTGSDSSESCSSHAQVEIAPSVTNGSDATELQSNLNNNHSISKVATTDAILNESNFGKDSQFTQTFGSNTSSHDQSQNASAKMYIANRISSAEAALLSKATPDSAIAKRKMRLSAGRSETMLPTGSRTVRSAKGQSALSDAGMKVDTKVTEEKPELAIGADDVAEPVIASGQRRRDAENHDLSLNMTVSNTSDSQDLGSADEVITEGQVLHKSNDHAVEQQMPSLLAKEKGMLLHSDLTAMETKTSDQLLFDKSDSSDDETDVPTTISSYTAILEPMVDDVSLTKSGDSNFVLDTLTKPIVDVSLDDKASDEVSKPRDTGIEFQVGFPDGDDDDVDLDEIIDIGHPAEPCLTDTDDEAESGREKALTSSMASRVSWGQQMKQGEAELERNPESGGDASLDVRGTSASSKMSQRTGRRTPLMYRAEKNLEMMEDKNQGASDGSDRAESTASKEDSSSESERSTKQTDTPGDYDCDTSKRTEGWLLSGIATLPDNDALRPPGFVRSSKSLSDLASVALRPHGDLPESRRSSFGDLPKSPADQGINGVEIARAFSYHLTTDEWLWEKVYTQQVAINNRNHAWSDVAELDDPYVLSALMWSWLEHLEEPVLRENDVRRFLDIFLHEPDAGAAIGDDLSKRFEQALAKLNERGVSCTILCIVKCIVSFEPQSDELLQALTRRTVIAITHSAVDERERLIPECNRQLEEAFYAYLRSKAVMVDQETRAESPALLKTEKTGNPDKLKPKVLVEAESASINSIPPSDGSKVELERPRGESAGKLRKKKTTESARSTSSSGSSNTGSVTLPSIVVS